MMSGLNSNATRFINFNLHCDFLTGFFSVFNFFGGPVFVILLTVILFFVSKKKNIVFSVWILGSYLIGRGVVEVLKRLIYEPRPFEVSSFNYYWLDKSADGSSFPSGHAMTAFLLATLLTKYFKLKGWKRWAMYILAFFVAMGRVYLGVHWFSDVAAGSILGVVFGLISWKLYVYFARGPLAKQENLL